MTSVLSDTAILFGRYQRRTLASKPMMFFGALMPLLYLVFFGPLLQDLPLGARGDSWQVLVPGLLVQLALFSAGFAGFGVLIEKQHGVIERMRVTPVSRMALLLGRVSCDVCVLLLQSLLLVLVALAFGLRAPLPGILIGFAFVAVLTLSLASLSYAVALRARTPQEFAPVINTVNMPAVLLSGVLLPMALAPAWLDAVSHFVPFRYLVDAVRAGFVGEYTGATMLYGVLAAAALAAVSVTVGTRVFRRAGA
ncbi:ABC transporter permease [Streptomyces sp. 8N706]|uniref:ABC transporter permease n=1 Tax=Streptomyces sp. 8N706 TaxID=3457416 RepID=UPI003FD66D13